MSAALRSRHVTVEEYLSEELDSPIKREYLGGFVYAMSGARNAHNRIASNVLGALHARLRGKPCEPYNSGTKIRVKLPTHTRFYYPDVSVVCDSNPPNDTFQDRPVVIVEVLSDKTRRIDHGEKKDAYLTISTLHAYLLVEQDSIAVMVHRRTDQGFVAELHTELESLVRLAEIGVELSLSDIYDRVDFAPEPEEEEL